MRNINKKTIRLTMIVGSVLLISGCGEWGIDKDISIPACTSDVRDASAAVKIKAGTVIKPLEPGTRVRVWHYANSDKLVCTISGRAFIKP